MSAAEQAKKGISINLPPRVSAQQNYESSEHDNEQAWLESQAYKEPEKINWDEQSKSQRHRHDGELHELRKKHSRKLFILIILWLIADFFFVLISGYGRWPFPIPLSWGITPLKFSLDSKVLIALLVTTTATVLGLYAIAAKWLFNGNSSVANTSNSKVTSKKQK